MDLAIAGGSDGDQLLQSLSFKLPSTAQYVQGRRLVTFQPSGASSFSPSNNRVAIVNLNGQGGWVDPASIRLMFKVRNLDTEKPLIFQSSGHSCWSRLRIMIGGTVVEDIQPYSRVHELFRRTLINEEWVGNEAAEGLGKFYVPEPPFYAVPHPTLVNSVIEPNSYATLLVRPCCGLLSANKMLPCKYAPITMEWTLSDVNEAVIQHASNHPLGVESSTSYEITEVQVFCAQVQLDSALEAQFASLLMSNRALQIPLSTIHTQQQALPSGNTEFSVSLVRALTRLSAIYVTFMDEAIEFERNLVTSFINPSRLEKEITSIYGHEETLLEFQCQIGSKLWPETPAKGPQLFNMLREATATYDESIRTLAITPQAYKRHQFVIGVPLQSVPGAFASGLNTRSGDLLSLRARNLNQQGGAKVGASRIFVMMNCQMVLSIREGSVDVLD